MLWNKRERETHTEPPSAHTQRNERDDNTHNDVAQHEYASIYNI